MKKNYFTEKLNRGLIAFTLVFCAFMANTTMAQKNIAWTGATNNNWSTASNWNYPAITSIATFSSNSPTLTLTAANSEIALGDKVTGYGIAIGTTITGIDATQKIITISPNTFSAVGTPGTNVAFTFATPKAATGAPTIVDIAVIANGGNPTLDPGSYYLGGLTVSNNNAAGTASTLTIPSTVDVFIETLTNEGVLVKGGNIVNNGFLDIKSSLGVGTNHLAGAYGMTFGLPSVVPTVATEYTYSGSGSLTIDTTSGNNFSGGFLFNGADANANLATYKILFNGTTNFLLTAATAANGTANTHLMRFVGVGTLSTCKIVLGGAGFDFGTEATGGVTNGLFAVSGGGIDVTIDQGTTINMFSSSANPTPVFSGYVFGATSIPIFFKNNGTMIIKGSMQRSSFGISAQNNGVVNFVNNGLFDLDLKFILAGSSCISISNNQGATAQADVNFINTGTMTFKNSLNNASAGSVYVMTTFGGAPNLHINNSGTLTLSGSNFNFGNKPFNPDPAGAAFLTQTGATRITNSGTLTTNQDMRATYTTNTSSGTMNFTATPNNVDKLVTFTVPTIVAASVGTTYTDEIGNVHTVKVEKVTGTGTSLITHVAANCVNPPARTASVGPPVVLATSLTKTGAGAGDALIDYTVLAAANDDKAHFQPLVNSGVVNTNPGNRLMTIYDGLRTPDASSVISPGGDNGKGRVVFGEAPLDAFSLKGTIKMQISGNTTAGIDYDFLRFPGKSDVIDISGATLDVTGIYTPTSAVTVDILTTYVDPTLPFDPFSANSGAIKDGGPFASVIGLTPGWKVNYVDIIGGKVQLSFDPNLSITDNAFSKFKFNYYPNPTSNLVNLSAEKNIGKVELYTITGQKVQSNTVNSSQKQLNISNLQRGVYLMEVSIDNVKKTFKIVKQ